MTNKLLIICVLLLSNRVFGQIPNFTNYSTSQDTLKSEIFNSFSNSYDFALSLQIDNYSNLDQKQFYILAFRNGKWCIINYNIKYKMGNGLTKLEVISRTQKKRKIRERKVKNLFAIFDSGRIWDINLDSANVRSRKYNDSLSIFLAVNDGISYKFEFISSAAYRVLYIDNPEYYLEAFPENHLRANFLNCIKAFSKITF